MASLYTLTGEFCAIITLYSETFEIIHSRGVITLLATCKLKYVYASRPSVLSRKFRYIYNYFVFTRVINCTAYTLYTIQYTLSIHVSIHVQNSEDVFCRISALG